MKIEVQDEIKSAQSEEIIKTLIEVSEYAAFDEIKHKNFEISITITDNEQIRQFNREYRNIDSATDVLSFPLWNQGEEPFINPENNCIMLGDIIVSLERAKEQANEYGHSLKRECAYLCVHAVMHLLGYDHIEEEDKKIMRAREEEILTKLKLTRED